MNGKRLLIFLSVFFLVQHVTPSQVLSNTTFSLPQITQVSVDATSPGNSFKQIYESIYTGLAIYKLDAIEKCPKERLAVALSAICHSSDIAFDLNNISFGKKGWTRYYPFSIGDKNFIMRIFLTGELRYQSKVPVLYEGALAEPNITFQILPSINDILAVCKIKPIRTYSFALADRSP